MPDFEKIPVCSVTPFTMQDFPGHTACILWFGGCNMRCAYCHNPELVLGKKQKVPWKILRQFLQERMALLDGVVLSGGESSLSDDITDFTSYLRMLGYKVKLDTNGLRPDILRVLLDKGDLDYVALDYKAPRHKFAEVTGSEQFDRFHESLKMLCESPVPCEVRTTVHTALLDQGDIAHIMLDLETTGFNGNYYLQNCQFVAEMLTELPEQLETLDLNRVPLPEGFLLQTRNFHKCRNEN